MFSAITREGKNSNTFRNVRFSARRIAKQNPDFESSFYGMTSGANFHDANGVDRLFWVYILENAESTFYIGQTDDLQARLQSHNRTASIEGKFTRKNGPWSLVWSEEHGTRAAGMVRERQIKRMKSARWIREELLQGRVPTGRD